MNLDEITTYSGWMSGFNFKGNKLFMFPIVKQEKEYPHYFQHIAQYNGSQFLVVWLHTLEVEIFDATIDGMIRLKKFPLDIKKTDFLPFSPFRTLKGKEKHFLSVNYLSGDITGTVSLYDLDSGKPMFTYEHPQFKGINYYDLNFETKELAMVRYGGWFKSTLEVSKVESNFLF